MAPRPGSGEVSGRGRSAAGLGSAACECASLAVLGQDHPDILASAANLAISLRKLGDVQAARDLAQDTLDRRRRVLGQDHPDTLASAANLAADLRELGEADDGP